MSEIRSDIEVEKNIYNQEFGGVQIVFLLG